MLETQVSQNKKLSRSLGNLVSFKTNENGISANAENAGFKVILYSEDIFRIHISFDGHFDEQSYAVIANTDFSAFAVEDNGDHIKVYTHTTHLIIAKNPVRFSFHTPDGTTINEDDKAFGTSIIGEQVTTYKTMQPGERFIGLGEKTGPLDRKGHGYQHWNTDHFGYDADSDPLYCSTPFYIGAHNQLSYGIFFDNSHKSHINFGASNDRFSSFSADSGDMNYYFINGKNVADIIESYTFLTGRMELPPLWSLGYQQCRYSYYPDKEVHAVAQTFRDKDIPADVIVLDIHYMDAYKIFSWDKDRFPDPKGMLKTLKDQGFKVVVMCDPGIKIEEGYAPYENGKQEDIFVKYPDGTNYSGEVWPGWCHFPDFTNPKARNWWKENLKAYTEIGVEGFWNDMNEIATWGQMLPELIEFDFEGEKDTARKGRNIFGLQMAKSTYEGTKALMNGKRPFNLTRAGFSGIQRYAAVWTGDNVASDEHMLLGVRLVNSMGLAGIPFAGYDVGGFAGNATEHLFARWVQIGAFSPFFRGHSMINSRDSEPWAYGEEVEEISRNYIKLRYKLMPYIYRQFQEASQNGLPVARSLAMDYTHDENIYLETFQNQYLFGPSILVAPVESTKELVKVYLPEGKWYELFTDKSYEGNQEIVAECPTDQLPLFVKSSAIIPVYPETGINTQDKGEKLEIHVYAGNEENTFVYYEDDGETYDFEKESYYQRTISYSPEDNQIRIGTAEGKFNSQMKQLSLHLHGFEDACFAVNGKEASVAKKAYQFVEAISNFDPIDQAVPHRLKIDDLKTITLNNSNEAITISW
ncbi:MAG: glycoside hydrolase family 31 protein [Fulvivirga sp.]